ncbi:MAG: DNA primase [Desulfarculus sp.]|nr:DNA primase [Desulfarculus sp.]
MSWALENLTQAQREAECLALLAAAGRSVTGRAKGDIQARCPLPGHEDKNPSWGYSPVKDLYACGSCPGGDLVHLYAEIRGLTDAQALLALKAKYLGQEPSRRGDRPASRESGGQAAPKKPDLVIDEDEWSQAQPLTENWLQGLEQKRGWSREVIQSLDLRLWVNDRDRQRPWAPPPGRVAIPIHDGGGRLVNVRLYLPGATEHKIFSWYQGPKGQERVSYGAMRLFPSPIRWRNEPLWLCEGEADCLCALSHGLNAATKTGGGKSSLKDHLDYFTGRDVVICYDADQVGAKGSERNALELAKVAKLVRVIQWPAFMLGSDGELPKDHGQDVTDWFVRHGRSAGELRDLLASARAVEAPAEPEPEEELDFPRRFFRKSKSGHQSFKPALLAKEIREELELITDPETDQLYRWNGQHWQITKDSEIIMTALKKLGIEASTSRANDACAQVKHLSLLPQGAALNADPDLLCLQNGEFNLATGEIMPHRREHYLTYQLPIAFDPRTPLAAPRWETYLQESLLHPETLPELQEFFGYCLTRDVRYHKALILQGPGRDGKSVCLGVLRALVGQDNYSAVALAQLDDQNYRAMLFGKLLNVDADIEGPAFYSGYFKKITGGDPVSAAFKYEHPFNFVPTTKLAFSCQSFPRVLDNSYAFYRRVLPIKFEFKGRARDPTLQDRLLEELPAIFGWAWVGLARLRARGEFQETPITSLVLDEYRRSNNPVLGFVEEDCSDEWANGEPPEITKQRVYDAYATYCKKRGFGPLNAVHLARELRRILPKLTDTTHRIEGKKVPHWVGISLVGQV